MTKQCVVFSTPGLIPIEAFTVFGMNAKPNSTNPFGFFGTGLKIAIAVCLRNGLEVVIWRGKDKYTFYLKTTDFRGKEFSKVRMKKETTTLMDRALGRPTYHDLPFTTELGKTWELWQAFREFQTNTMDENGETYIGNVGAKDNLLDDQHSIILVAGQKFVDEYHDRDRNFLPDGLTERAGSDKLQVLDRPSKHVYYRGVRVWDLKEEAAFTYNFLCHIDLTEDRTAKYPFLLEAWIADYIMESEDEKFVERTVSAPTHGFERKLSYAYADRTPTPVFISAARESPNVAAKEKVRVVESVASSSVITISVPKAFITDEEHTALVELCTKLWGEDTKVESR